MDGISMKGSIFQVMPPLLAEEYAALKADIAARGVQIPIEVDADTGEVLDGFHRLQACHELGLQAPTIARHFDSAEERLEHAIKLNMLRRQLGPIAWAKAFKQLCQIRGVQDGPGRPNNGDENCLTVRQLAAELGVSRPTAYRRMNLATELSAHDDIAAKVDSGELSAKDALREVRERETGDELATHQLISQSGCNEWYTPIEYIQAAKEVMGSIDLDPASSEIAQRWIQAHTHYTIDDDGLTHDWHGRVWLNPPWGRLSGDFVTKLVSEMAAGRVTEAIVLVNAHSTDAQWFQPLWDGLLCFTDHRINYEGPNKAGSGSTHGSVFIYFGTHESEFVAMFAQWGPILAKVNRDDYS